MATVRDIQVCGSRMYKNLYDAVVEYMRCVSYGFDRAKFNFAIILSSGEIKHITIRQEDDRVVAYGDFDGLPNALGWAQGKE